jgi:hypothetical protein
MTNAARWIRRNWILLTLIVGTVTHIAGTATLAGMAVAAWLGTAAGWAAAASVAGVQAAYAALRASQLAVIDEEATL